MLMQTPPFPPINRGFLSSGDLERILVVLTIIAVTFFAATLLRPLVTAFARRIEGRGADPALRAELEQLRDQVAELEPMGDRVHELEERLEFAERLLAQRRDQELLPKAEPHR